MAPLVRSTLNAVVLLFVAGSALATQEEFRLQRLDGAIKLDGHSDEPAWQIIVPLPLTMRQPTFSGTPTERTEIRLAYDDDFLYASGRFYDSDPCGVRVNSLYRDRNEGDDTFDLIVDTFNDNENALWFWTNRAATSPYPTTAARRTKIGTPYGKLPAHKTRRVGLLKCACHFPVSAFKTATGEPSSG
ncbi:MAG: hypothetical protein ACREOI_17170 [bacterium]